MMAANQDRRFDPALLDQVLDRTPLASLIGANVALKKAGRAQTGCCPFHGEKTPSFNVYEKHFHCFGCGEHGNAFDFVRKNEGISFPEAVKRLAADAGIDLPQGAPRPSFPAERAAQEAAAQERQRRIEAKYIADARDKDAREEAVAKQAEKAWAKGTPAPAEHPYLARKEIGPDGLRVDAKGNLLVPMRDEDGKLWNLQTIAPDGKKMSLWRRTADGVEGGRTQGLSAALGTLDGAQAVVVAEGRATGASVREATGLPVRVAFSSNNLAHVVRALRERHPDLLIIVAADNDHQKERLTPPKQNVGLAKGEEAIKDVPRASVLAPQFEVSSTSTDWNDYRAQHGAAPIKALFDAKLLSIITPKQEAPLAVQPTPISITPTSTPTPPAAPTPSPAIPATVADLVAELGRQAVNNSKAERYIAELAKEIRKRPELETDSQFQNRVAGVAQSLERNGATIPMTQELRDLIVPKTPTLTAPVSTTPPLSEAASTAQSQAPTSQNTRTTQQPVPSSGQAATQPQPQNRAIAAFGSAMAQIYAALRPPQPATPPPWEQVPQPLGNRLEAFERRSAQNAITTQTQAAQLAGEHAQATLAKLGAGPGGAILNQIKETAQNEPGGMPAVVAEMAPGGRFADLRTAFNAALVQERAFASAYDRAVSGISAYGDARLKLNDLHGARQMDVSAVDSQFEGMDKAVGQASEALPGRKDGKSVQDEIAEKAQKIAEFLKDMVRRIGNAVRPAQAPTEMPAPTPAASPAMAPAMAP